MTTYANAAASSCEAMNALTEREPRTTKSPATSGGHSQIVLPDDRERAPRSVNAQNADALSVEDTNPHIGETYPPHHPHNGRPHGGGHSGAFQYWGVNIHPQASAAGEVAAR